MIEGAVIKPGGGGSGRPPPFRVTVPSVDVDWEGFTDWNHEGGEDARHVIVPFTNAVPAIRWLWVQIPYDDYGIVHPFLTLHCVDANALCLLHEAGTSFPNGGQIDSRAVPSWPIRFRAEPLAPTTECIVRVLGEADNVTGEKAADTIHGRVVNVDLDVDANYDGAITDADEPKEEDPGGYACVCTNSLTPIKLTLEPGGLTGTLTLSATAGGSRVRVWQDAGRAAEVPLTTGAVWNAGAQPGTVYVEGVAPSAALRDVALRLEYDENPAGQSNPLFKCEDRVRLTVLKIDMITPAGDPVISPIDGGDGSGTVADGANEFTFSAASSGILTLKLKAHVTPSGAADSIKGLVRFTVDGIGASTMAWAVANPGGKPTASGDDLLATAAFTGLPANNSDFGSKKAAVYFNGNKQDEESCEVFYPATTANHPGGTSTDPNWFFYYKQNAGGGSYTYTSVGRSSSTSAVGDASVKIGNEAYAGDQYITTQVSAGQLEATGWSVETNYYANFLGVLAHERHHANNETTAGPPTDSDGDFLAGSYETNTTQTDPNDKFSARGVLIGSSWDDGEVYAGGPIEQNGIQNADTSQDWADPGTNSKP